MTLALHDPRKFSKIFPDSNLLINQAQHDLANNESNELMQALIEDLLRQKQDQLLSVAYNLSPSLEISNYIWDNLQAVINNSQIKTKFFVFPVVLVVGSKQQVELSNSLDSNKLADILLDKQFINSTDDCIIDSHLYDIEAIARIKPSDLYSLSRNDILDSSLNTRLLANPILNIGEGVHLRFILCQSKCIDGKAMAVFANYDKVAMDLMQLITDSLKREDATIFPIPFAPCDLSVATVIGDHHRKEIALTFALSNQIKKLRLAGKSPELKLSAQKNNIQVEIWLPNSRDAEDVLIWSLQPADNFEQVCQILESLFIDMQLKVSYYEEHHHD